MQDWLPWVVFPLVGALIGWATNWLAVKMLFRPHRPVGFGPLRFQGVVPRRQKDLAENIADTVQEELISPEDIADLVQQLATRAALRAAAPARRRGEPEDAEGSSPTHPTRRGE